VFTATSFGELLPKRNRTALFPHFPIPLDSTFLGKPRGGSRDRTTSLCASLPKKSFRPARFTAEVSIFDSVRLIVLVPDGVTPSIAAQNETVATPETNATEYLQRETHLAPLLLPSRTRGCRPPAKDSVCGDGLGSIEGRVRRLLQGGVIRRCGWRFTTARHTLCHRMSPTIWSDFAAKSRTSFATPIRLSTVGARGEHLEPATALGSRLSPSSFAVPAAR
jgi:hypothetical protein